MRYAVAGEHVGNNFRAEAFDVVAYVRHYAPSGSNFIATPLIQ